MNAAKAASRIRSRTAVSAPLFSPRFDFDVVAIPLSRQRWYRIVPLSLIPGATFSPRERLNESVVPGGTNITSKFRWESKERNYEDCNVFPAAGFRNGLGAPGARPVHTPTAYDHRRAHDPYAKTGGYGRASHENHARRNSCDRSPVSRRQNSAVVHARRRQGRDLHTELQGRGGGSGPHRGPTSLEGKPRGRAVHSGRATVAARNTIAR